jgi:hypothetical protein
MADLSREFWIRETGTGQRVAQLHDRYMMAMMMMTDLAPLKFKLGKVPQSATLRTRYFLLLSDF